jgi:hypothetical protein
LESVTVNKYFVVSAGNAIGERTEEPFNDSAGDHWYEYSPEPP